MIGTRGDTEERSNKKKWTLLIRKKTGLDRDQLGGSRFPVKGLARKHVQNAVNKYLGKEE